MFKQSDMWYSLQFNISSIKLGCIAKEWSWRIPGVTLIVDKFSFPYFMLTFILLIEHNILVYIPNIFVC